MKKAAATKLQLFSHPCPLCGQSDGQASREVYPARLSPLAFSKTVFSARRAPDKLHYRLVRCTHDGLVRSDPILSPKDLNQLYQQSHFTYEREVTHLVETYLKALAPTLVKLDPQASILEIGCGNGFMLEALSGRGFESVFGVEPSHEAVAKATKKIQKKITQAPFSAQLFQPASFECIVLFQTLDHIPDLNQFLTDCYTLLKPGGYFISYHHDVSHWLVKVLGEAHPIIDVEHTQLFDQKSTKAVMARHGLTVRDVTHPWNRLSLRHALFLLPLPASLKSWLTETTFFGWQKLLQFSFKIKLGNLCVVAQKPVSMMKERGVQSITVSESQKELRRLIVKWSYELKLSHLGSCLSCVDSIAAIYAHKKKTDEFILSSGHAAFAWYAVLYKAGSLSSKVIKKLSVHPDRKLENGIGVSSGSLGQGLPIAVGKALANRQKQIYCLTSDGEWSEGSMVESLRIAVAEKLDNVTIVVNCNGWAAFRPTSAAQLLHELKSFGAAVVEVNGHSPAELKAALTAEASIGQPKILFAHTTVEQIPCLKAQDAHYRVMNQTEYREALACLK